MSTNKKEVFWNLDPFFVLTWRKKSDVKSCLFFIMLWRLWSFNFGLIWKKTVKAKHCRSNQRKFVVQKMCLFWPETLCSVACWMAQKSKFLYTHQILTFAPMRKGQIKPKADSSAVDSPKKWTKKFVLFAFLLFTANKTNSFVRFLEKSTARPNCFWLIWPLEINQMHYK